MMNKNEKISLGIIVGILIIFAIFLTICLAMSPKYVPSPSPM